MEYHTSESKISKAIASYFKYLVNNGEAFTDISEVYGVSIGAIAPIWMLRRQIWDVEDHWNQTCHLLKEDIIGEIEQLDNKIDSNSSPEFYEDYFNFKELFLNRFRILTEDALDVRALWELRGKRSFDSRFPCDLKSKYIDRIAEIPRLAFQTLLLHMNLDHDMNFQGEAMGLALSILVSKLHSWKNKKDWQNAIHNMINIIENEFSKPEMQIMPENMVIPKYIKYDREKDWLKDLKKFIDGIKSRANEFVDDPLAWDLAEKKSSSTSPAP